jgi:hypothetical protein
MGFNRRKMEDQRRAAAETEAARIQRQDNLSEIGLLRLPRCPSCSFIVTREA